MGNDGRAPSNGPVAKYKWSKQALFCPSVKDGRESEVNQQAPARK